MLSTGELATVVSDAGGYASAAWSGIFAVICFGIAFNVSDAAFRIYHFVMNHGPFAPGRGSSPTMLRILGATLGTAVLVECLATVRGDHPVARSGTAGRAIPRGPPNDRRCQVETTCAAQAGRRPPRQRRLAPCLGGLGIQDAPAGSQGGRARPVKARNRNLTGGKYVERLGHRPR